MAEHQTLRFKRPPMLAGMFRDRASAERAYASLTHRGYTKVEITLVMSHEAQKRHFGHLHDTELGSKAVAAAPGGSRRGPFSLLCFIFCFSRSHPNG
jgi:hypothetical protein